MFPAIGYLYIYFRIDDAPQDTHHLLSHWKYPCLHLQSYPSNNQEPFQIFSADTADKSNTALGYTYAVTWATNQDGIEQHGFILRDYSINTAGFPLSFKASVSNINPSGADFNYNPSTLSRIMKVSFSIVVRKYCDGKIDLKTVCKYKVIQIAHLLLWPNRHALWTQGLLIYQSGWLFKAISLCTLIRFSLDHSRWIISLHRIVWLRTMHLSQLHILILR